METVAGYLLAALWIGAGIVGSILFHVHCAEENRPTGCQPLCWGVLWGPIWLVLNALLPPGQAVIGTWVALGVGALLWLLVVGSQ